MRKDQRNLILSLALAGTVLAGVTTPAVAVTALSAGDAFMKISPVAPTAGAFYKESPSAISAAAAFLK